MQQRALGPFEVSAISLGCMNVSHAYGIPPDKATAIQLLNEALDLGYSYFDTATIYGFGANESLLAEAVGHRRSEFMLGSKCGMFRGPDGKRVIDSNPETLKQNCEASLQRLKTECIDLYYLHRWDKSVPIEDSVGALSELVAEGKIKTIGLSEVSAETLRKAHNVHPIAALQSEYSLWTRNPEIAQLEICKKLGVAFVAFSPLARAFLTGTLQDVTTLSERDLRRNMPRFEPDTYAQNLKLLHGFAAIAKESGCSMAQLALAWLLAKDDIIIPIPGTTQLSHLRENASADAVSLSSDTVSRLDGLINQHTVCGPRYNATTQPEIDTEEFA
ncbi:MAG: aldo/keto reductase [Alphaproteobacteria bacterium]